jgi:hypothetical protein
MSEDRLYGNWLRPQRLNIRGVGWKGALVSVIAYFTGLVILQSHPRAGLLLLGACLGATGLSALRIGGASAREFIASKARWRYAVSQGTTSFTAIAPNQWRLPGPLAGTRMVAVRESGRTYGAVHDPTARRIAVTLDLASTAADLTDAVEHDVAVARWERWLESLGRRPEVAWVSVTVETSPSPGTRLREAVQQRISSLAPLDCQDLMHELVATSPAVAAGTQTRLTITFDLRTWDTQVGRRGRRRSVDAYLPLLDRSIASLESSLDGCGVTVLGPLTPTALGAAARVAFDPAASGKIELALAALTPVPNWALAGPTSATEHRDRYVHDSGTSVSFVWAQAPRQLVASTALDPLTRPGQFRKRVTCTYVPTPSNEAMDAATAQVRWRWFTQTISRLPVIGRASTAQDQRDTEAAEQATYEVAAGAGWIAQTITATITVLDPTDLPAATAEIEHAAGASQLRLRRLYELQAAGFCAGLPVGLSLTELAGRWAR